MISIKPYQPDTDEVQVYDLWLSTLGNDWPVPRDVFHAITVGNAAYREGDHFVALFENNIVGFVGYQVPNLTASRGGLIVILVASAYQRQGVGRALHDRALEALKQRGVSSVQVGAGALHSFWPGVPVNLPAAWAFFQACGWTEQERTFDLVGDLDSYSTPPWVYERIRQANITVEVAKREDVPAILEFEARNFPGWLPYYQQVTACDSEYGDVVVAKDVQGNIVGTSFVHDPHAEWYPHDMPWTPLLGENTGGVGPLGVAEAMRGCGSGLALAAKVTELLAQRGIARSFVGYTWLVDWYGRLGYNVWREYYVSRRTL
jgi:GNAT superfamily N-acetyltransferase